MTVGGVFMDNLFVGQALATAHELMWAKYKGGNRLEGFRSPMEIGMPPWRVAEAFSVDAEGLGDILDRYELQAIGTETVYLLLDQPSVHSLWTDTDDIPLFSPLEVWRALERYRAGDLGRAVPAISCETDEVLRAINRGYESVVWHERLLTAGVHDGNLLSVVFGSSLEKIESWGGKPFWKSVVVAGYREETWHREELDRHPRLRELWALYGASGEEGWDGHIRLVSPTFLAALESTEKFEEMRYSAQFLVYKAIVVCGGQLPEQDHNRMLMAATEGDEYALAYFRFLKGEPLEQR